MTNGIAAPSTDPACPVCDGTGICEVDRADWRGQAQTIEIACTDCEGTGERGDSELDGLELAEWAEAGRCEAECLFEAPQ